MVLNRKRATWVNGCCHGEHEFVASVADTETHSGELVLDVYLYQDTLGLEVCLRYGDGAHEYMSCGPVAGFLAKRGTPHGFCDTVYGVIEERLSGAA